MSVFVDAANYFFRGAPWTGSAYPDPPLPSTASGFSACGLAYRSVVSGASFEPLLAMSGRFNSAGYFFTGWRDSANIYADSGGGLADVTPDPAIANWFQWMVSADPAGNQLLFAWKYYGDAAWNMSVLTAHYGAQTLRRLFLGTDEWGTGVGGKAAMANVRVWFKLKTPASLLTEVNSNVLIDTAGIHAWWKLRDDAPTAESSGNARVLTMVGAPSSVGLPANSLEAPSDTLPEIFAIASANVKRWQGSGNAQAEAQATSSAKVKAWQGSANAYAETLARASAQWKHWNGSANASVLATAVASAKFKKWRSTGTAKAEPIIPPIDPGEPPIMDADVFTRIRGRAANVIAKYGDTVWFYGEGTPASENSDGTWTEATDETRFDAKGIQTRGDPDELGLGLSKASMILHNPVTILVAAVIERSPGNFVPIASEPVPKLGFTWANTDYRIAQVLPVAPNGKPIYYVVVGDT